MTPSDRWLCAVVKSVSDYSPVPKRTDCPYALREGKSSNVQSAVISDLLSSSFFIHNHTHLLTNRKHKEQWSVEEGWKEPSCCLQEVDGRDRGLIKKKCCVWKKPSLDPISERVLQELGQTYIMKHDNRKWGSIKPVTSKDYTEEDWKTARTGWERTLKSKSALLSLYILYKKMKPWAIHCYNSNHQ